MIVIEDVRVAQEKLRAVALTIGSFDGVHLGHQRVLHEVITAARGMNGTAAVMTLRPHPRELFSPAHAPNLLTTDAKKLSLFEKTGIEAVFFLRFTQEVAQLEPETFVEDIVHRRCAARAVVVGHDFRFGRDARGDYDFLRREGQRLGFVAQQVAPLLIAGECVSSSLIREYILEGDVEKAATLLGRKYSILGEVIPGRGIGAGMGFPTANIRPQHSAVPAHGVYAAQVVLDGEQYPAAVNIGIAPTIRHEDITIEAFILDFSQNILGRVIEIVFHERLRPEQKFSSRDLLAQQIRRDVETVRGHFGC